MWLSATVTVKRPKKYATKLWTKLATNFKLVRWGKTNRKRRREKYECKKSCSRPHTHRHTQPHTGTHRHIHMQMVLLPLCVVVVFPLFSPPRFFCLRLLDTLLCIGIIMEPCCVISVNFFCYCQQHFFPNFPNLPSPLPASNTRLLSIPSVPFSQCWHLLASFRTLLPLVFLFCLHSARALLLYFYYIICSIWIYENRAKKSTHTNTHTRSMGKWEKQTEIWKLLHVGQVQIYAVSPNKFGNKFKIKVSSS